MKNFDFNFLIIKNLLEPLTFFKCRATGLFFKRLDLAEDKILKKRVKASLLTTFCFPCKSIKPDEQENFKFPVASLTCNKVLDKEKQK
jgi:hypothetical protein